MIKEQEQVRPMTKWGLLREQIFLQGLMIADSRLGPVCRLLDNILPVGRIRVYPRREFFLKNPFTMIKSGLDKS